MANHGLEATNKFISYEQLIGLLNKQTGKDQINMPLLRKKISSIANGLCTYDNSIIYLLAVKYESEQIAWKISAIWKKQIWCGISREIHIACYILIISNSMPN